MLFVSNFFAKQVGSFRKEKIPFKKESACLAKHSSINDNVPKRKGEVIVKVYLTDIAGNDSRVSNDEGGNLITFKNLLS